MSLPPRRLIVMGQVATNGKISLSSLVNKYFPGPCSVVVSSTYTRSSAEVIRMLHIVKIDFRAMICFSVRLINSQLVRNFETLHS